MSVRDGECSDNRSKECSSKGEDPHGERVDG